MRRSPAEHLTYRSSTRYLFGRHLSLDLADNQLGTNAYDLYAYRPDVSLKLGYAWLL